MSTSCGCGSGSGGVYQPQEEAPTVPPIQDDSEKAMGLPQVFAVSVSYGGKIAPGFGVPVDETTQER